MARRRWRDYQTPRGARPVRDFLRSLSDDDYANVRAAMDVGRIFSVVVIGLIRCSLPIWKD